MSGKHFQAATVIGLALFLQSLAVHGGDARQILENTDQVRAAVTVRQEYIEPMQLAGKDFRSVLGTLLDEGFSCSVKDGKPELLRPEKKLPAMLDCRTAGAEINKLCEVMFVGVVAADERIDTRSQLLSNISSAEAGDVVVFCAAQPKSTAEARAPFEQNQQAAEQKLAERGSPLNARGKTATAALSVFLQQGYECRLAANSIVCNTQRTDVKYCFREKVTLELDRSATAAALDKLVVQNQKSACELPD